MKAAIVLFAGLGVGSAACGGPQTLPRGAKSPLLERPLPSLEMRDLDGRKLRDQSLRDRVVVVKFFAKYCGPCHEGLAKAAELSEDHPQVTFVGVSMDENPDDALEMVSRYKVRFRILYDRGGRIAGRFRVSELPATFVIGKSGKVIWSALDETDGGALGAAIEVAESR